MNKVYIDVTDLDKCVCIAVKDKEVIKAGSTVYPMSSKEKNVFLLQIISKSF